MISCAQASINHHRLRLRIFPGADASLGYLSACGGAERIRCHRPERTDADIRLRDGGRTESSRAGERQNKGGSDARRAWPHAQRVFAACVIVTAARTGAPAAGGEADARRLLRGAAAGTMGGDAAARALLLLLLPRLTAQEAEAGERCCISGACGVVSRSLIALRGAAGRREETTATEKRATEKKNLSSAVAGALPAAIERRGGCSECVSQQQACGSARKAGESRHFPFHTVAGVMLTHLGGSCQLSPVRAKPIECTSRAFMVRRWPASKEPGG